ncbi:hypothetical protein [Delftia acidovorans]|uniref:hypothetical protein n=1 Tax=Delftia acidovorans TaxID=80866 RepID=UPI00286EF4FF|nr:hypothetical protein [Delftia acidovorans]
MKHLINPQPVTVGGYYIQRGTLVRVSAEGNGGGFHTEYVQITGDEVICGGHSGSWPASDYGPISDPVMCAAAMAYESERLVRFHQQKVAEASDQKKQWVNAMAAIKTADAMLRAREKEPSS